MLSSQHIAGCALMTAVMALAISAIAEPTWTVSPAVVKNPGTADANAPKKGAPAPAPLRKDEAREKEEFARLTIERIFVEGVPDSAQLEKRFLEQRFAASLNRGNPEIRGGKVRHGAFYDGFIYWGNDPVSFLWLNSINRLRQ